MDLYAYGMKLKA